MFSLGFAVSFRRPATGEGDGGAIHRQPPHGGREEVEFEGQSFQHLPKREASPGPEEPLRMTTGPPMVHDEVPDGGTRVTAEGALLTSVPPGGRISRAWGSLCGGWDEGGRWKESRGSGG